MNVLQTFQKLAERRISLNFTIFSHITMMYLFLTLEEVVRGGFYHFCMLNVSSLPVMIIFNSFTEKKKCYLFHYSKLGYNLPKRVHIPNKT